MSHSVAANVIRLMVLRKRKFDSRHLGRCKVSANDSVSAALPRPRERERVADGDAGTIKSNRGFIAFTNGANTRFVSVELQGNRLLLQSSLSK